MQIRFEDDCLIDTDRRQVSRAGQDVGLSPKAYELLRLLIEARPKAVAKETLYRELWPHTYVVEANLPNLVGEIRAALGDSARHPRIIRTLHRFGYAFAGHAEIVPPATSPDGRRLAYWLRWNLVELPLRDGENLVGRDPNLQICLDAPGVSRRHARVVVQDDSVAVEDLDSKNGTFVCGERITSQRVLLPGDDLSFGSVRVTFHVTSSNARTETIT
jgi:DNA-binding winged helix-turn-helix (wHTH) protein